MDRKHFDRLKIEEYSQALILPRKQVNQGPMWGLGGVVDDKDNFVNSSFYDGGWATHGGAYQWEKDEVVFVDQEVIYVGMFYSHWGHFLIDLTNRYWAVPQLLERNPEIKIAYLGEEEPKGNNLRFLELLGIKKEQFIHIVRPTRFKKVYVPEQGFKSCEWYTEEHISVLDYVVNKVLRSDYNFSKVDSYKKVYFTRRKFSKAVSSEFGEEYFEKIFADNGYVAVAPETLTLDEQIYLWNYAEEIVCMNGSIPLNVMFSKNRELKLVVLNKTSIYHENPMILLEMRDIHAKFLNIYNEPFRRYPKSLGEGPYLLWPTDDFNEFCLKNKLSVYLDEKQRIRLFRKIKVAYIWYIIGIERRMKRILFYIVPEPIKKLRRNIRK